MLLEKADYYPSKQNTLPQKGPMETPEVREIGRGISGLGDGNQFLLAWEA